MFDEICSIYKDKFDSRGNFVDTETGECIKQMSIHDFCLTDRWKPYVQKLRGMVAQYGVEKAKKMPEYDVVKGNLPGATLSGLFAPWLDQCYSKKTKTHYMDVVSRRETHLQQHTGWLAIDIDHGDNLGIMNWANIFLTLRFRPEVGMLMHSCSGTGLFGLVRLAHPDHHKEQFNALLVEYRALGINLDPSCCNIGRVRFASWDDPKDIYLNPNAVPYEGMMETHKQSIEPVRQQGSQPRTPHVYTQNEDIEDVERLVRIIENRCIDITGHYLDCWKIGVSLTNLGPVGLDFWERICRFRSSAEHTHFTRASELEEEWRKIGSATKISIGWLFKYCRDAYHITLR